MAEKQSTRETLDFLQWRFYFFEDFTETESAFVFKCHHSLADGIAIILMYFNLQDKPDMNDMPRIAVKFSFLQNFICFTILPFIMIKIVLNLFFVLPAANNGLKNPSSHKSYTPLKRACFSESIPLEMIKAKGKELGVTLNDVVMTVLSNSLKEYYVEHANDNKTDQVHLAVPYSLRPPPVKSASDFNFDNQFAILPLKFKLTSEFASGLKVIKADMDNMKTSVDPFGYYYIIMLLMLMPHMIRSFFLELFVSKLTFVFSNVPGPRSPFIVG